MSGQVVVVGVYGDCGRGVGWVVGERRECNFKRGKFMKERKRLVGTEPATPCVQGGLLER